MLGEILSGGLSMTVMKYNETWVGSVHLRCTTDDKHGPSYRRMRRASHEALNKTRVTEFYPLHAREAVRLVDGLLHNPNGWGVEFFRWV